MTRGVLVLACGSVLACGTDHGSAAADTSTGSESSGAPLDPSSSDAAGDGSSGTSGAASSTGQGESTSESGGSTGGSPDPLWTWDLPPGFPEPHVPVDNPMSLAKVELGRWLFYDKRLSRDGTYSCATCHRQELAFTDGLARSVGVTGDEHPRGAMTLVNVAYRASLGWADPELLELEDQVAIPMFGTAPVELGLVDEDDAMARIADEPLYDALFAAAFPDEDDPRTFTNLARAIASFERSIISGRTSFDRWFFDGDESALSEAAKRGWERFNAPGECQYCHFSFDFTDSTYFPALPERTTPFHNTALYNLDGAGAYPPDNQGVFAFTGVPTDMGRFKSPSLRNLTRTAPYMHDGSSATLEELIVDYSHGGRVDTPIADGRMKVFALDHTMTDDLIALFESLSDDPIIDAPAFSDPWVE